MAPFSKEELAKINELLNRQAAIQQEINGSLKGYADALEKVRKLTEEIKYLDETIQKFKDEKSNTTNQDEIDLLEEKIKILELNKKYLKEEHELLKKNVEEANKFQLISAATLAGMVKGIKALPGALSSMRGNINSWGLLEMDKAIRMSVLEMGLLGENAQNYRSTVEEAAMSTLDIGVGIEELTALQSAYSQELGRTVMLTKEGLEAMAAMSVATGLGSEGTAQMAADMENQGISAERTADYMKDSMTSSSKLGLNASKVIKNIAKGIGLLNRYNFRDGYRGLERMAKTVTKLGVEMDFAAGMADKMFDIEGAVDMAAQLQVLGGAWANLADPFKLAYMARNDMAALTEEIGKAAGASAVWDEKTKDFKIGAMEMDKMRIIAQQTGASLEDLVTAAKNFKKFEKVGGQLRIDVDEDTKEFIQNTAKLDENGEAKILIHGDPKFVKNLNESDKAYLKRQQQDQKNLKERAELSQTFDEQISNIINKFKTALLPALEGIDEAIKPILAAFKEPDFTKDLIQFGKDVKDLIIALKGIVTPIAKLVTFLGPTGIIATMLVPTLVSLVSSLMSTAASVGKVSPLLGKSIGLLGSTIAGFAGGAAGMGLGGMITRASGKKETEQGTNWGMIGAAALGLGTILATGGAATPLVVAGMAGAGGLGGKLLGDFTNQPVNDAISTGDSSKNRGLIQNGTITPIDNQDDVIAYKPNGPVDKSTKNTQKTMKIAFEDININGEIQLILPGNQTISVDLANNPGFINAITTKINMELEKRVKGMNIG